VSETKTPRRAARRGSGGVTINDVAKLAGVSAITVSRALNQPATVSPLTLEKVKEAVASTGYVPNLLAGGLASNRSRLVAALVPTIVGPMFLQTIEALTEALAEAGCQVLLGQSGYADSREDALIDAVIGRRPEGIVLTGITHSAQSRRKLAASGIPIVETWDLSDAPIDMLVGFSHREVGVAMARYMMGRGYRRPVLLTADDHRAGLRGEGFIDTFREHGIEATTCAVPAPGRFGDGRTALASLRRQPQLPDAVFCSSDVLAHGLITEALVRGLRVPEDIAVAGFGDLSFAADVEPALTTVHIDGPTIGRQAARFITERAAGRDPGPRVRDVGFAIVERKST
jgi:LacI family gluconate utilization system Gnt-I transcriptional repressor